MKISFSGVVGNDKLATTPTAIPLVFGSASPSTSESSEEAALRISSKFRGNSSHTFDELPSQATPEMQSDTGRCLSHAKSDSGGGDFDRHQQ